MKSKSVNRFLLAALTAIFAFISLGTWAIASPVGASPDEDFHLASIWCALGDREGLCAPGDEANERIVPERLVKSSYCFAWNPQASAACDISNTSVVSTSRGNFESNYPPVFYSVMGIFAGPDITVSVVLMRLFNAALFVGIVTAVLALLKPGQRGPLVWTSIVSLVPLGVFLIPSINPSSWSILAGLTAWLATYGYFTAESRGKRIALGTLSVALTVMGAGARGDSAAFVAFAALVAAVLTFEKTRVWAKLALLPLANIVISTLFFLAAGQSTGIVSVGVAQATTTGVTVDGNGTTASFMSKLLTNLFDLPWLWTGGTGTWGLGWLDTRVPPSVWVLMIGALTALVFWGLQTMNRRKGSLLILGMLALVVIPLYALYGLDAAVGDEVQPRYLLPLLLIVVGVALYGFTKDHLGISRLQGGIVLAATAFAYTLSLHKNMRRYITGLGDRESFNNLNANIEWWWTIPASPMVVWFIGSVAFALTLVGVFLLLYPKGERPGLPLPTVTN